MKPSPLPPPAAAEPPLDEHDAELLKAAAQAWHGHSGNPRQAKESDPIRHAAAGSAPPSRFRIEAARRAAEGGAIARWDFAQSLWDSYEIVTVSRRLESSLALDHPLTPEAKGKRARESLNSLRRLFRSAPPGE